MALSNNPLVTAGGGGSGANVAGYVGEVNFFADSELRKNHVWADGTTFDETAYPDLKEYAQANNWKQDSSGKYLTPVLTGSVSGDYGENDFSIYCQIRAKVDTITMSVTSITDKTLSGFTNGDIYIQKNGKVGTISSDELSTTEWESASYTISSELTNASIAQCDILYNKALSLLYLDVDIIFDSMKPNSPIITINNIPTSEGIIYIGQCTCFTDTSYDAHIIVPSELYTDGGLVCLANKTITRYMINAMISMANAGGEWPTIGEKKYLTVTKASGSSGDGSIEVIWNNTATTEQFTPQVVPCNSEGFDSIAIKCKVIDGTDSTIVYIPTIQQENETVQIMYYSNGGFVYRDVTFSPTALTFGNGYKISTLGPNTTPDIDNSFIPTTIYGVVGGAQVSDCPYDVGDILETKNSTNPSQRWPGTEWTAIETFLLGASETHAVNSTGGEETHRLAVSEMPAHTHFVNIYSQDSGSTSGGFVNYKNTVSGSQYMANTTGGSQPHNNMPPYTTVYIWERTA